MSEGNGYIIQAPEKRPFVGAFVSAWVRAHRATSKPAQNRAMIDAYLAHAKMSNDDKILAAKMLKLKAVEAKLTATLEKAKARKRGK